MTPHEQGDAVQMPGQGAPVVVLGGGIAGLAACDQLLTAGHKVTVIEKAEILGGAHRARQIGPYNFDAGSIFYEAGARLLTLAPGLAELCPQVERRQRRITPEGSLRHYPLEPRDLLDWPRSRQLGALASLGWGRLTARRDGTLEAICRQRLGAVIYAGTGLASYIARFNHVSAAEIDEDFFFSRMQQVAQATELSALARAGWRALRGGEHRRGPPHPLRIRPAEGYAPLFDAIEAALTARGATFLKGTEFETLRRQGEEMVVTAGGRQIAAQAVIGALPLDRLYRLLFGRPSGLVSLDLMSLYVSAVRLAPEAGNVLYNYHFQGRWKRATLYSRLYPELMEAREFFTTEVTLAPGQAPDPGVAFADLSEHLTSLGIAEGLRLEGHDLSPGAYPLLAAGAARRDQAVLSEIAAAGVTMVGRQGRFEYLPTSSGVIRQVGAVLGAAGLAGGPGDGA